MDINLNYRLEHASKKFSKACDQIKLLKQRIAELIQMFSYCEHQQQQSIELTTRLQTCAALQQNNLNVNLLKETVRQQIENLQSIKTAYFMYAHKKADEITKLQCELYGEDAVREAYEMGSTEHQQQQQQEQEETASNQENETQTETTESENYWTPWDSVQEDQTVTDTSFNNSSLLNHSSLINEQDYLIA